MRISYLDGNRLKHAVVAAAQRVLDAQERLNQINVFPVADGDTGTNMALTLKYVADGAINATSQSLPHLSNTIAESALMGARGNSGAILAQFFQGLADSFQNKKRVNIEDFATSTRSAVDYATKAVSNPTEGTIITVMRDWADHIFDQRTLVADFVTLMETATSAAISSLKATPKKLEVLAKAGVVDAGAQGFVNMLEGVMHLIKTGEVNYEPEDEPQESLARANVGEDPDAITFQYCTECLLEGENLDPVHIRQLIAEMGDSMIVAGNASRIKVHIHTDHPQTLFDSLRPYGTVLREKFDDMKAQHSQTYGAHRDRIALITDSSCDLPAEFLIKHKVRVVPVTLTINNQTYLDRVNITAEKVYNLMAEGLEATTSQPTPGSFKKAFAQAAQYHDQAIAVFVSSTMSGTYQAGLHAAEAQPGLDVRVVDSKTAAGSLGFIVKVAAEAIEAGLSLEEVHKKTLAAVPHSRLFAALGSLDSLVRSGRVSKVQGRIARFLNLIPIVSFNPEGKVVSLGKSRPGEAAWRKVMKIAKKEYRKVRNPQFMICQADAPRAVAIFKDYLLKDFGVSDVPVMDISPTVGVHVGHGTAGLVLYGEPKEQR